MGLHLIKWFYVSVVLLILLALLPGCGAKGDLYLPEDEAKAKQEQEKSDKKKKQQVEEQQTDEQQTDSSETIINE
jgi:predicted small lipoprotein YifL